MTWLILLAYVVIPLAFIGLWFIDLWAKSYDLPGPQALAKVVLCTAAAAVVVLCMLLLGFGLQHAEGPVHFVAWASAVPVIVGLTWVICDLDWRSVYAVTLTMPALVPFLSSAARHDDHLRVGAAVATLLGRSPAMASCLLPKGRKHC